MRRMGDTIIVHVPCDDVDIMSMCLVESPVGVLQNGQGPMCSS